MNIGDKFASYEVFQTALTNYKKDTNNEFWLRDCRTIQNQRNRNPHTVENVNPALKYYYIRLACIKGGRPFVTKNNKSKRKCSSYKQECPATIFLKVSNCKQFLCVQEVNDNHNHTTSSAYFNSLARQRLNLPKNVKRFAQESLNAGANKKIVLDKIRLQTGCKLTLKDLTNLANRSKGEKKNFEECVQLLKNAYKCSEVDILVDQQGVFKGLYFQDKRMKTYMEAYSEVIFIDGTYCLVDLQTATYIIMVEDGNGLSEIVAVCLLAEENQESINFFIETFKKRNPNWEQVKVIMSDKDKTERKVFSSSFPKAKLMIYLFHVFQIFNREVSNKKMGISTEEVQISKNYLQKLAYACSEKEYNEIYNNMVQNLPKCVIEYYNSNWGNITDQWVQYLTLQNLCLTNKTNNRLECINSKLKSVISRYSPLEDFIKHIFIIITSLRTGKDVKNLQILNKRLVKPYCDNSAEHLYCQHLTAFAFEKVERQLTRVSSCKDFEDLADGTFLTATTEGLLQVTPTSCECLFRTSIGLPCRHIFKCRSLMSLPLFDANLCLTRWTRSYLETVINNCETNSSNIESYNPCDPTVVELNHSRSRILNNHEKFKIMQEEGRKLSQLCSEVSTEIFYKRLNIVQTIAKFWSEQQDEALMNLFTDLVTSHDGQVESDVIATDSTDDVGTETSTSEFQCSAKNGVVEDYLVDSMGDLIPNQNQNNNNDREEVEAASGEDAVASEMVDVGMTVEINSDNGMFSEFQCSAKNGVVEDYLVDSMGDLIPNQNQNNNNDREEVEAGSGEDAVASEMVDVGMTVEINSDNGMFSEFQCSAKNGVVEDYLVDSMGDLIPNQNQNNNNDREEVEAGSGEDAVASEMVDVGMTVEINSDNGMLCDQTGSDINPTTIISTPSEEPPGMMRVEDIKMPSKVKKRGRPKGYGNTVIGLKRKRTKN